jgi:hypothetical protein
MVGIWRWPTGRMVPDAPQCVTALSSSSDGAGAADDGGTADADGVVVGGAGVGGGLGVGSGITEPSGAYHTSSAMGDDQLPATSRHWT